MNHNKFTKSTEPSKMFLLPPKPGVCQECATDHHKSMPHNAQSLYYQMKYKMETGKDVTWKIAMDHCDDEMKKKWTNALKTKGVIV